MKVLIACEESQRVCIAFRERGHEAYSCDILECSGGHLEWHIQGDVLPIIGALVVLLWFLDCVAAGFIIWILSFLLRFRFTIRLAEIGGSVAFAIEGAYTVHCMKE